MRFPKIRSRVLLVTGFVSVAALIGGCPLLGPASPSTDSGKLVPFQSAQELVSWFSRQNQGPVRRAVGAFTQNVAAPLAADEANAGSVGSAGGSDAATPFSGTNLQEEGVDESDVMKSDGSHFYLAKGSSVRVVRATPLDTLQEVGRVNLGGPVDSLYLRGSTLIALSQRYRDSGGAPINGGAPVMIEIWPPYALAASVVVSEIDISDPTTPTIVNEIDIDGSLATSRLTNDRLILVMTHVPSVTPQPIPLLAATVAIDDVLPHVRVNGATARLVEAADVLHPESPDGYFMTNVVTLDAADVTSIVASTGVMAAAGTIYSSTEELYVTNTDYDSADNFRETTAIHKFAFDNDGAARYVASGSVPGRLLNQFSLSEFDGVLRVATNVTNFNLFVGPARIALPGVGVAADGTTTIDNIEPVNPPDPSDPNGTSTSPPPSGPFNAVYTLAQNGGTLEVRGALEDIAPGEQLFAARFLGDRAYLVTFVQIDPLFVVDLADPADPALLGQLKAPGFSDYLHILDSDHLIGVGRSVSRTDFGATVPNAVQLSLFDVSDPANPVVVDQVEIGGPGSFSDVSSNAKAFAFLPQENLLALPVELTSAASAFGVPAFDGVLIYRVDPASGFSSLGALPTAGGNSFFFPNWRRGAFIGDNAYSISTTGVVAAPLGDLANTSSVTLEADPNDVRAFAGIEGDSSNSLP